MKHDIALLHVDGTKNGHMGVVTVAWYLFLIPYFCPCRTKRLIGTNTRLIDMKQNDFFRDSFFYKLEFFLTA